MQDFNVPIERKELYGEVATDYTMVDTMLDLLPKDVWKNKNLKWMDIGCGQGYISDRIVKRLTDSLLHHFKTPTECRTHIIKNMLYMVEVNPFHRTVLRNKFGENANIILENFLDPATPIQKVDVIVENPPYNINGAIKTPTNSTATKKVDGITVWREFLFRSLQQLNENGYLSIITPSIWMRNDKFNVYTRLLTNTQLLKCHCLSASETIKAFHGKAQTPTVMFSIKKCQPSPNVVSEFWDNDKFVPYSFEIGEPLPLKNYRFLSDVREKVNQKGHLNVKKTNCLSKKNEKTSDYREKEKYPFIAIKSRSVNGNLVYEYCKKPTTYQKDSKIIMANKMYGMPIVDDKGVYGISTRDNYVILGVKKENMNALCEYIDSDYVQKVFDSFRYRMRYLEKEAFLFVPKM